MTLFVKLCGIRSPSDLTVAIEAGADAVGFVLTPSPRQISVDEAARLKSLLPRDVLGVAVFHDPAPDLLRRTAEVVAPDLYQAEPAALGGLPADRILPVVVDAGDLDQAVERALASTARGMVLVDSAARGGTGRAPDWERLASLASIGCVVLAGGLDPGNVGRAVSRVRPLGVDVSSGIERRPGEKDPEKMHAFVAAARSADALVGGPS